MEATTYDDLIGLCAAYALGSLDPEDSARLLAHLAGCETCQRDVAGHQETVALLSRLLDPVPPPATAEARLMALVRDRFVPLI